MKKQLLPILIAALSLGLAACGNGGSSSTTPSSEQTSSEAGGSSSQAQSSSEAATVASIALGGTYQTEYYLNDGFNPDGLVVTATMSDGTTKVVDEDEYEVSGFDSTTTGEKTVTISYGGKSASFTVNINPEPTYDVTIALTVDGIADYSDFHTHIYMNSEILGSAASWGTQKLTQDGENPNLWTIEIPEVHAGSYEYNFYYGTSDSVNWTYGKNVLDEGTSRSISVSENTKSFNLDATFNVPAFIYKDITLKLTPSVLTSYGGTPADLTDGVQVWAYNSADDDTVLFEKQTDGTWTRDIEVPLDVSTGEGVLKYTATLSGNAYYPNWDYQQGGYSGTDNAWESWHDIEVNVTTESETVQVGDIVFKDEPEPLVNPYFVTFNVSFPTGSDVKGIGLKTDETSSGSLSSPSWKMNLVEKDGVWTGEYVTGTKDFTFCFNTWGNDYEGDSSVGKTTDWWSVYTISVTEIGEAATVNLNVVGDPITSCTSRASELASEPVGCTVS